MHSVQSLGKRLEKEKESLTRLPETEWAILPRFAETEVIKNGKTVKVLGDDDLKKIIQNTSVYTKLSEIS